MKQLMFILVALIFASCNNVGPEDEVLATDTGQVAAMPVEPETPKVNEPFESLEYTTDIFYITRVE